MSFFINHGTYSKIAEGETRIQIPFTNDGTVAVSAGTLRFTTSFIQSGGALVVTGTGALEFDAGLTVSGGMLSGTGTITGNVISHGLISPGMSAGQLTVDGNLTLLATSTLLIELGGTTQGSGYDHLAVTGNMSLNGLLQVGFTNGFGSSVLGSDVFTITSATSMTGAFANVPTTGLRLGTFDGLGSFQVNFGGTAVTLSNFQPIPEPSTWMMIGVGTVAALATCRRRRR